MTIRRRKREQARQQAKQRTDTSLALKSGQSRAQRLNHVMSTSALLDAERGFKQTRSEGRPLFTLSNSSSIQGQNKLCELQLKELKSEKTNMSRNTTGWNSTDSIDAPLLWHRKQDKSGTQVSKQANELQNTRWNITVPNNLMMGANGSLKQPHLVSTTKHDSGAQNLKLKSSTSSKNMVLDKSKLGSLATQSPSLSPNRTKIGHAVNQMITPSGPSGIPPTYRCSSMAGVQKEGIKSYKGGEFFCIVFVYWNFILW